MEGSKKLAVLSLWNAGETKGHECSDERSPIDLYGCHKDADTTKSKWVIPCPICLGDKCSECLHKGYIRMEKCPNRYTQEAFSLLSGFYTAFRWAEEKSILPISGGLCDQTAQFIRACGFMNQYIVAYRKMKELK